MRSQVFDDNGSTVRSCFQFFLKYIILAYLYATSSEIDPTETRLTLVLVFTAATSGGCEAYIGVRTVR